jgi:hypothetical protein
MTNDSTFQTFLGRANAWTTNGHFKKLFSLSGLTSFFLQSFCNNFLYAFHLDISSFCKSHFFYSHFVSSHYVHRNFVTEISLMFISFPVILFPVILFTVISSTVISSSVSLFSEILSTVFGLHNFHNLQ